MAGRFDLTWQKTRQASEDRIVDRMMQPPVTMEAASAPRKTGRLRVFEELGFAWWW